MTKTAAILIIFPLFSRPASANFSSNFPTQKRVTRKVYPFWCAKAGEKFDLSFSDREKDKKSLKWTFLIIFSRISSGEKSNFSVGWKRLRKGLEKADLSARGNHAKQGGCAPKLRETMLLFASGGGPGHPPTRRLPNVVFRRASSRGPRMVDRR